MLTLLNADKKAAIPAKNVLSDNEFFSSSTIRVIK